MPFLGGLPQPRSNSEHPESMSGDTPSDLSLQDVDIEESDTLGEVALGQNKKNKRQADSKRSRSTPIQKVDVIGDEKPHAAITESEDEKLSNVSSSQDESDDAFTIYDAVAGRLGYDGLVKDKQQPVAAADYLFRYQQGPEQDENYQQFSAHRNLKHRLPDSDLLKAIHAHASDFYGALPDTKDSFGSMDETALIAMGILLEEATAGRLGETGDLAFVEAARPGEVDFPAHVGRRVKRQKVKHESAVRPELVQRVNSGYPEEESSADDQGRSSGQKRRRKATIEPDIASDEDDTQNSQTEEEEPSHNSEVESWISQTLLDSPGEPSSQLGAASELPIR